MPITDDDTAVTLSLKLAAIGADLMIETLHGLQQSTITPRPQNNAEATLAPILTKVDGRIDFTRSAQEIYNRFRGFQPWPGAFTTLRRRGLNVTAMKLTSEPLVGVTPKQLLVRGNQLFAGCGVGGVIELLEVQPEGKKRIPAKDFIHGYRPQPGENLDS